MSERVFKSHIYINLYQHTVGDIKKHSGQETQFLLDTGATCSIINYRTFKELFFLQKVKLHERESRTVAVNGQKLKLLGYIEITSSFDIEGSYNIDHHLWVSAKDGCKVNILGMDFLTKVSHQQHVH